MLPTSTESSVFSPLAYFFHLHATHCATCSTRVTCSSGGNRQGTSDAFANPNNLGARQLLPWKIWSKTFCQARRSTHLLWLREQRTNYSAIVPFAHHSLFLFSSNCAQNPLDWMIFRSSEGKLSTPNGDRVEKSIERAQARESTFQPLQRKLFWAVL